MSWRVHPEPESFPWHGLFGVWYCNLLWNGCMISRAVQISYNRHLIKGSVLDVIYNLIQQHRRSSYIKNVIWIRIQLTHKTSIIGNFSTPLLLGTPCLYTPLQPLIIGYSLPIHTPSTPHYWVLLAYIHLFNPSLLGTPCLYTPLQPLIIGYSLPIHTPSTPHYWVLLAYTPLQPLIIGYSLPIHTPHYVS